jgi:8-oxo-dGTP diphosphatase
VREERHIGVIPSPVRQAAGKRGDRGSGSDARTAYRSGLVRLYLVRHAPAGDRQEWDGPDVERPISKKGRKVADAVADALAIEPITRVLSSPAVRCLQTVAPLAARLGLEVEPASEFAEGAPVRDARATLDLFASEGTTAVVCGHGDLIPELLEHLENEGTKVVGAGCTKGSVWQLEANGGHIVRAVYHGRPGDPQFALGPR